MNTIWKGRLAEAKVIASLVEDEFDLYVPLLGNGPCDVIATRGTALYRIEVKYTSSSPRANRWDVSLKQTRPNRTGVITKKYDATQADTLAVYVQPIDRVLFYSASHLHGRNMLTVRDDPAHYSLSAAGGSRTP